jgi:hypothetical protein
LLALLSSWIGIGLQLPGQQFLFTLSPVFLRVLGCQLRSADLGEKRLQVLLDDQAVDVLRTFGCVTSVRQEFIEQLTDTN